MSTGSLASASVHELLDAVAARTTAPGGGAAAALTTGLAAALTAMAARFDADPARWSDVIALADETRTEATALADADVAAYARYVTARRADSVDLEPALDGAVAVPLQVTALAARIASAASTLAAEGNPRLRGDAVTGCWLAAAAAQSASVLVAANFAGRDGDERVARARRWADEAHTRAMALGV